MANTNTEAMDKLKLVSSDLMKAVGDKAMKSASDRVGGITDRLEGIADGGPIKKAAVKGAEAKMEGESPVKGAVKGLASGIKDKVTGGGGKGSKSPKATKATNIIESIDVGVPIRVAYNQWTEFGGFPTFMKKVEKVEAQDDNKLAWKAQIVWSHRTWEASILEQIPDERIVWKSKGEKGHVDGAVTFHELGPNLTRILIVLEYYPQGLFERTGNIWRAQGRRVRAEFKHFRRHVMTRTILEPDEVEGWRGTIEDGEVVQTHEEALEEEQQEQEESERRRGRRRRGRGHRGLRGRVRGGRGGSRPRGRVRRRGRRRRRGGARGRVRGGAGRGRGRVRRGSRARGRVRGRGRRRGRRGAPRRRSPLTRTWTRKPSPRSMRKSPSSPNADAAAPADPKTPRKRES